jgi:hypothetical protein
MALVTGSFLAAAMFLMVPPAHAYVPLCYADTAAAPVVHSGATISSTGSGHCGVGVSSITVSVCLQHIVIHPGFPVSYENWTCGTKHPGTGVEATVTTTADCVAGHTYGVRTRTIAYGSDASGATVSAAKTSSDVSRTCKS